MADEAAVGAGEPVSAKVWDGDGPGVPGSEDAGALAEGTPDGPAYQPIRSVGTDAGPFVADVGVVEGAKCAVRTLARKLAGVADSEVTVPASAEVSSQSVSPFGAQWVMSSDLTPGKLYFVMYDAIQLAYFVDAYAPVPGGRLTVPREHGYA
jgi:hypothetical protein